MKSEDVGLIAWTISFQDFPPMWSWSTNVTDGQTDRRHAISRLRFALSASRARGKTRNPSCVTNVQVKGQKSRSQGHVTYQQQTTPCSKKRKPLLFFE